MFLAVKFSCDNALKHSKRARTSAYDGNKQIKRKGVYAYENTYNVKTQAVSGLVACVGIGALSGCAN